MRIKQILGLALAITMVAAIFTPAVSAADDSKGIDLTAIVKEPKPEIGITVDTDHIDFGELLPGNTSSSHDVTTTNVGLMPIDVTMSVEDDGTEAIFVPGIEINGNAWGEYSAQLVSDQNDSFGVALHVPDSVTTRGDISGTLTVWAQEHASVGSGDWAQWQNCEQHYAVHFTDDPVTAADQAWNYSCGLYRTIDVTPLIVGDIVYIIDSAGQLHAVDKNSGQQIWVNSTEGSSSFTSSIPAYGDGKVFAATNGGYLCAFDALSGERLWSVKVTASFHTLECPITYYDHHLYIGEGLGGDVETKYYYCYDDQGNQVWKYPIVTSGFIWGGAVVVGDYLVFPVFEDMLVSVDRLTGEMSDEVSLIDPAQLSFARPDPDLMIRSSITYADGYIYSTCEHGQNIGFIFKTGFSDGQFLNEGWSTDIGFSTSTPVVYDGRVYVGNGEHGQPSGNLTCLDDTDGSVIWAYHVDSGVKSSPALFVHGHEVYIYFAVERGTDGSVYCVNGNGQLVWEFNPSGDSTYILQGVALSSDAVYFGTGAGKLYCLGIPGEA